MPRKPKREKRVILNPGSLTKRPIFKDEDIHRLIEAADSELERPAVKLMVEHGAHPTQIGRLEPENLHYDGQEWTLHYGRVKNRKPIIFPLTTKEGETLKKWLAWKNRPRTRQAFFSMCKRIGLKIGFTNVSPMTLRHTAAFKWLTYAHETGQVAPIDWVAMKMGCSREIVMRNYIAFDDWTQIRKREARGE